ncbi:MAG TPA: UbiA family prenyltransferase [Kouleothrix sp.]|uniref:UbiA family prenyltransferase n=1 Tax=Kouleothrix sp. TaxID=2779161 RepID=UPI002BC30D14|nr:UbiA family prenyltransferase [Kouleothrix sp.]
MAELASPPARIWRAMLQFQLFIRFPAFGFTVILPFLGAASAAPRLAPAQLAGLLALALAFHSFSYVENDVIDLPLDRRQPLRQADPLVRGAISPAVALAFALAQVPLALALTFWLGAPATAYLALAAGFALMTVYNLWGKRVALPVSTDMAQGLAWAALALYGAIVAAGAPTGLTFLLSAYVVLYVMLINSIHGSLRDLANDFACGKRSTAILLGARPLGATQLHIPARLRFYAFALQYALIGLLAWPLLRNDLGYGALAWAATALALALLAARCLQLLAAMLADGVAQADLIAPAQSHVFLSLAMLVALFVAALTPGALALLLAACIAPLLPTQWWARQMRKLAALPRRRP